MVMLVRWQQIDDDESVRGLETRLRQPDIRFHRLRIQWSVHDHRELRTKMNRPCCQQHLGLHYVSATVPSVRKQLVRARFANDIDSFRPGYLLRQRHDQRSADVRRPTQRLV